VRGRRDTQAWHATQAATGCAVLARLAKAAAACHVTFWPLAGNRSGVASPSFIDHAELLDCRALRCERQRIAHAVRTATSRPGGRRHRARRVFVRPPRRAARGRRSSLRCAVAGAGSCAAAGRRRARRAQMPPPQAQIETRQATHARPSERVITHTHSATREPAAARCARPSARLGRGAAPSTCCSGRRRLGGAQGQL